MALAVSITTSSPASAPVFRIDKFVVPTAALPAFLEKMRQIHHTVRALPGCVRDSVLTQTGGTGLFNVVHLVEWVNAEAVAAAQVVMQRQFALEGFNPNAFFVGELGAQADLGLYVNA